MKRLFANTLVVALVSIFFVACNDEVKRDHDRDRSEENSQHLPGAKRPSHYTYAYDTIASDNRSITPDSNRYIGSMVDTMHGLRDNQPM